MWHAEIVFNRLLERVFSLCLRWSLLVSIGIPTVSRMTPKYFAWLLRVRRVWCSFGRVRFNILVKRNSSVFSFKSFSDIKEDCLTILLILEGTKKVLRYLMGLLWGTMVTSKSKLVVWNGILYSSHCHHSTKENSFE